MDESWVCSDCGYTNQGRRFCFECGRDGDPDQPTHQGLLPEPEEEEPRWRRFALIGGAVALLLAAVTFAVIALTGSDSPKTAAVKPPVPPPVAASKLNHAQTVDELMKIVVASRVGLAATRKGEWAAAVENRKALVGRLDVLATKTDAIEAARKSLKSALVASEAANTKSLACKDQGSVSACAAPAHEQATVLKERFRQAFNKILAADKRDPVAPNSF